MTPAGDRPFVDAQLSAFVRIAVDWRAALAPLLAIIGGVVWWLDPTPWRRALMVTLVLCALVGAIGSAWQVHRRGLKPNSLAVNLTGMALLQAGMITGTGGLLSPLLVVMLPMCLIGALLIGRRRQLLWVLGVQVGSLGLLVLGQTRGWLPHLPLPPLDPGRVVPLQLQAHAFVTTLILIASAFLGSLIHEQMAARMEQALAARDAELAGWQAQNATLKGLSREIGHELKNPLASIKGLAALLARGLPEEGRPAQRLSVLRSEVDRMESTLEELLTFSRPLLPLSLAPVDPRAVLERVCALHEGVVRERRVELRIEGAAPGFSADPRKLQQILLNLLQNAFAVAPPGSTIDLKLSHDPRAVRFEICDRGAGLPEGLRARLFEAGVSGRREGSGLGLPIARGLARQHGGALELLDRPGGGVVARLELPHAPTLPGDAAGTDGPTGS